MPNKSTPPGSRPSLEKDDLRKRLVRIVLDVGYVFAYLWLAVAVIVLAAFTWATYFVDPAQLSPDSLSRNSPTVEELGHIGFAVLLVAFGVLWLFLTRYLRRRLRATLRNPRLQG